MLSDREKKKKTRHTPPIAAILRRGEQANALSAMRAFQTQPASDYNRAVLCVPFNFSRHRKLLSSPFIRFIGSEDCPAAGRPPVRLTSNGLYQTFACFLPYLKEAHIFS